MKYQIFILLSIMNLVGFGQSKKESKINFDKELKMEEMFVIGDYNFSFDKSKCIAEYDKYKVIEFTFVGNDAIFEGFDEKEDFEFSAIMYPPQLYIRDFPFEKNMEAKITDNNDLNSETGLYFGEHGLIDAQLFVKEGWTTIIGLGEVFGKKYPIKINFKL